MNSPKNKHAGHKKHRAKTAGTPNDLIWGIHPVYELLQASPRQIMEVRILAKSAKLQEIIDLARDQQVPCQLVQTFPEIDGQQINHQGVLARIKPVPTMNLSELLKIAGPHTGQPLLLALDCVQDPHNFGAIIRSAAAAGVKGIIYPKDRSAPLSGTVAKVSVGAINRMNLCPVTNLVTALQKLQKEGFWVFGAAGEAAQSIYQTDFKGPVCLVIGGEGKGIRALVRRQCDFLVSIPMHGGMESLNASIAAAIIMFEIIRQQRSNDIIRTL